MVKDLLHTVHANGLSPVCVRMCIWRALALENGFSHTWQVCFCATRRPDDEDEADSVDSDDDGFDGVEVVT